MAENNDALREFDNLENNWAKAIISNDSKAIAHFMADDWVIVGETGVSEKSDFLKLVESGDLTHEAMEGKVVRVRVYDHVAVAISRGTNNGKFMGKAFSSDEWITDVFVKQEGRWRCVLTHLTPAKAAPPIKREI